MYIYICVCVCVCVCIYIYCIRILVYMPKLGQYDTSYCVTYVMYIISSVVYNEQCSLAVHNITGTSNTQKKQTEDKQNLSY